MTRAPLTLIHGWGCDARVWGELPQQLQARLGLAVTAIDLPGYGEHPGSLATPDTAKPDLGRVSGHLPAACFAAQVADLAEQLPLGGTVCGWSLGAQVAMQLAARHPERVNRLILIGASPRFVAPADPANQGPASTTDCPGLPAHWLTSFRQALATDPTATRRRFIALMHQGDIQARALSRQMTAALLPAPVPSPATLLTGLDWLEHNDLIPLLPDITQPTWLLHGQHDPLMPVAAAHWLAGQLPHAQLQVFADCAHAPFLSAPDAFVAAVSTIAASAQEPA